MTVGTNSIGDHAFRNCTGLTYIQLPDSPNLIKLSAFSGSGIKDVDYFGTAEPTVGEDVFPEIDLWLPNVASRITATKLNANEINYRQVLVKVKENTKETVRCYVEDRRIVILTNEVLQGSDQLMVSNE